MAPPSYLSRESSSSKTVLPGIALSTAFYETLHLRAKNADVLTEIQCSCTLSTETGWQGDDKGTDFAFEKKHSSAALNAHSIAHGIEQNRSFTGSRFTAKTVAN